MSQIHQGHLVSCIDYDVEKCRINNNKNISKLSNTVENRGEQSGNLDQINYKIISPTNMKLINSPSQQNMHAATKT